MVCVHYRGVMIRKITSTLSSYKSNTPEHITVDLTARIHYMTGPSSVHRLS